MASLDEICEQLSRLLSLGEDQGTAQGPILHNNMTRLQLSHVSELSHVRLPRGVSLVPSGVGPASGFPSFGSGEIPESVSHTKHKVCSRRVFCSLCFFPLQACHKNVRTLEMGFPWLP